jgi:hypothetical protein
MPLGEFESPSLPQELANELSPFQGSELPMVARQPTRRYRQYERLGLLSLALSVDLGQATAWVSRVAESKGETLAAARCWTA